VTLDAYEAVHGKEPAEGMNTFGWRELDGLVENFPTDDSENVFYGDSVPVYDEVHIGPCYSWCVHMDSPHRQATHRETSPHTDGDTGNDWKKVFSVYHKQLNANTFSNPYRFAYMYRRTFCVAVTVQ